MRLPLLVRMRHSFLSVLRLLVSQRESHDNIKYSCPNRFSNSSFALLRVSSFCSCSRWPHGCCYSVMALMSAYGSLYMTFTVIMSCAYQQITDIDPATGKLVMESRLGYGMLAREAEFGEPTDYQQCIYYPEDEQVYLEDSFMKGSTYSAYACAVLQVIACIVLTTTCSCAYNRTTFERWLMWTYIYASCCMALTFLMFGAHFCKENDCDMDNGSALAISSWMFLICCANMVKNMGQPPPDDMVDPDDDEDNLWYDDDAEKYPQRYEDEEFEEYGYEEEDSFGEEDEFAYDDQQYDDRGIEMNDTDFLDPNDPRNQGAMTPYNGSGDPYDQPNAPQQAPQYDQSPDSHEGGMVPHDPYAQHQSPSPQGGGIMPHDPYAQQSQQSQQQAGVGDRDGPELI